MIPKEVWTIRPDRTLCTELLGFDLCVRSSAHQGQIHFAVRGKPYHADGPSCVFLAGERPSAVRAMAAAEWAAVALSRWLPGRLPQQSPLRPADVADEADADPAAADPAAADPAAADKDAPLWRPVPRQVARQDLPALSGG